MKKMLNEGMTLPNCMELTPSWEANSRSATQKITHVLGNPKVLYRVHKDQPSSLCWTRWIQSISSAYFVIIRPNIISTSMPISPTWSLTFRFPA